MYENAENEDIIGELTCCSAWKLKNKENKDIIDELTYCSAWKLKNY